LASFAGAGLSLGLTDEGDISPEFFRRENKFNEGAIDGDVQFQSQRNKERK
jgi:hypothetical protein